MALTLLVALAAGCGGHRAAAVTARVSTSPPSGAPAGPPAAPPATPSPTVPAGSAPCSSGDATGSGAAGPCTGSGSAMAARATVAPAEAAPPPAGPGTAGGAPPLTTFAVTIGNNPAARPQSGLTAADIVWEINAEGGITRYLALYTHSGSRRLGPVRSTRIYFDQLVRAYGVPIVHAGGNVDALNWIGTWHLPTIDAIYTAGAYFWRGGDRRAPNNLYTSSSLVNEAERALHIRPRPFTAPLASSAPAAGGIPTGTVTLAYFHYHAYRYTVSWAWRASSWWRRIDGSPSETYDGHPVRAGTVVILVVPQVPDPDPHTPGSIRLLWSRGGQAWVLRDGLRLPATWRFGGPAAVTLTGPHGPLAVRGGQPVWYEVVPTAGLVSFGARSG